MSTRNQRGNAHGTSRSYNRYPTTPDGRGASTVTRRAPHGKDALAVEQPQPKVTEATVVFTRDADGEVHASVKD